MNKVTCSIAVVMCLRLPGLATAQDQPPAPPTQKPDDLATRLIRSTIDQAEPDPMDQLIESMSKIAHKLQVEFDAGEDTQVLQREVSAMLDRAIKEAADRRRAKSRPDPRQMSDKRTSPAVRKPAQKEDKKPPGQAENTAATQGATPDSEESKSKSDPLVPGARRGWGNLPERDREEVLQGVEEEFLERFRPWVEQYFRALQEKDR